MKLFLSVFLFLIMAVQPSMSHKGHHGGHGHGHGKHKTKGGCKRYVKCLKNNPDKDACKKKFPKCAIKLS